MMGYACAALAIFAIVGTVGGYYTGESSGFAKHEALANAQALANAKQTIELKDQDLAAERDLTRQANERVDETAAAAQVQVAAIAEARDQAIRERDAHAQAAEEARRAAGDLQCPEPPPPPEYCPWACRLPPLPS